MTTILAGLFMIGFLVVIHEAGHFVAAKVFGVGVPVFSVGMGPRIAGFEYKGTDYRLSALPIGGYVQMAGADPFGEEDTATWVPPDEDFMGKPVWQRLIIMAAGPGVNLALPFFLFTVLLMLGRPDVNSRVGVVLPGTPAVEAGFSLDDEVVAVDGVDVEIWHDVEAVLASRAGASGSVRFTVDRAGATTTLEVPAEVIGTDPDGDPDLIGLGIQPFYLSSRVGVEASGSPAGRAGLLTGDTILAVDGVDIDTWEDLLAALDGDRHEVTYEREGDDEPVQDTVVVDRSAGAYEPVHDLFANPWGLGPVGLFANVVSDESPAQQSGVRPGDRFLTADGKPVLTFEHFIDHVLRTVEDSPGQPRALDLAVVRDGQILTLGVTPEVKLVSGEAWSRPIIGVTSFSHQGRRVDIARKYYSLPEAIPRAVDESMEVVKGTAAMLGNLFTGKADPRENVGGPVAIFQAAGTMAEQGFFQYAMIIGMISVSLGVINLLPVPVLDGGQIVFYLVEAVRGRPLSLEIRERFQMVGVVGLVILMLLVTANDIHRWIGL